MTPAAYEDHIPVCGSCGEAGHRTDEHHAHRVDRPHHGLFDANMLGITHVAWQLVLASD